MSRIPTSKILDLWFTRSGASLTSASKVTPQAMFTSYFKRDPAFDDICREYEPHIDSLVERYRKSPITVTSPFNIPQSGQEFPNTKEDSLAEILLLDQFTRNIYRGKEARKVYTVTDPIAKSLSLYAISKNWHTEWHWLANIFLTLPLMHAEDVGCHLVCMKTMNQVLIALAQDVESGKADEKELKVAVGSVESQSDHLKIVNKFGRYPYRNEVVGRTSTEEEKKFLEQGGQSFGAHE